MKRNIIAIAAGYVLVVVVLCFCEGNCLAGNYGITESPTLATSSGLFPDGSPFSLTWSASYSMVGLGYYPMSETSGFAYESISVTPHSDNDPLLGTGAGMNFAGNLSEPSDMHFLWAVDAYGWGGHLNLGIPVVGGMAWPSCISYTGGYTNRMSTWEVRVELGVGAAPNVPGHGRFSILWGAGALPGEDPDDPIVIEEVPGFPEDEPGDDPEQVAGIQLTATTTQMVTPVSGSHGRDAPVYFQGASSTATTVMASLDSMVSADLTAENLALGYGFYSAFDGPKFSRLLLPEALPGGQDTFELFSGGQSYGMVSVGTEFDFTGIAAEGVSNFALMGLDPAEQLSPTAPFPMTIGLQFASDGAVDLHVATYSPIPEPSMISLLTSVGAVGAVVIAIRRRVQRRRPWLATRMVAGACMVFALGCTCQVYAEIITVPIAGLFRTTYVGSRQVLIPRFDPSLGTLMSATISYTPQYSGTVSGTAQGSANSPNGWAVEFSGTIRLIGTGFNTLDFGLFNSRSGVVYQPGTPIFEAFGPSDLSGSTMFTDGLSSYVGAGNVSASLSWPVFTGDLFFSRGGSENPPTRDLGAVGGEIAYTYTPIPEPCALAMLVSVAVSLLFRGQRRKHTR